MNPLDFARFFSAIVSTYLGESSSQYIIVKPSVRNPIVHRWYARPVFFVADVNRAIHFYVNMLGFEKSWHEADGAGTVCQVNHGECEIILCQDATRKDKSRLFIELTPEGLAELRREIAERSVPSKQSWWGYDVIQVDDPDGNELLFPVES